MSIPFVPMTFASIRWDVPNGFAWPSGLPDPLEWCAMGVLGAGIAMLAWTSQPRAAPEGCRR